MRTVLVTGTHGFIGSAFIRISRKKFTLIPFSRTAILIPPADMVIHLAARTAKTKDDDTALSLFRKDNVLLTKKLLKHNYSYFLYVSSMDVLRTPLTAYAQSKLEAEKVVADYCLKHNIPFGIARLGSVFGPGEGAYGKVIPTFIRDALAGRRLTVVNPSVSRKFIYVDDVARRLMQMMNNKTQGIVEITGGQEISIGELAKEVENGVKGWPVSMRGLTAEIEWFKRQRTVIFDVDGTLLNSSERIRKMRLAYKTKKARRKHIESEELLRTDFVMPGVRTILSRMQHTHRLIAVSSRQSEQALARQLDRLDLSRFFTEIIAVGPIRGSQAKYHAFMSLQKKYTGMFIAVGDARSDQSAARRAGIRFMTMAKLRAL